MKYVTDELKAQLPQETFAAQWAAIPGQIGPQESAGEPQIQQTDSGTTVTAESVHTLRRLVSTLMSEEQKRTYLGQIEAEVQRIKGLDPAADDGAILGASAVYWNSLNALDLPAIVRGLGIPMLILQGEEDFQVTAEEDFQLWKDTLAGRDDVVYRLYPGLSRLFSRVGSKERIDVTVYDAPAPTDGQVIADIAEWIAGI